MRRTHLRGHPNILKRLLIHVCGFNLALVMRSRFGIGKPRRLQDRPAAVVLGLFARILALLGSLWQLPWAWSRSNRPSSAPQPGTRLPRAA